MAEFVLLLVGIVATILLAIMLAGLAIYIAELVLRYFD